MIEIKKPKEVVPIVNLMKKIERATKFSQVGKGLHRRVIHPEGTDLCIKIPLETEPTPQVVYLMQMEYLMYQVSEAWQFHVVPACDLFLQGTSELIAIYKQFKVKAPHFPFLAPCMVQKYVLEVGDESLIELKQAQKVVLFNWIAGRGDSEKGNSIITKEGNILEIDNELTFYEIKDIPSLHWLLRLEKIREAPLDQELIDHILSLPASIVLNLKEGVFQQLYNQDPRSRARREHRANTKRLVTEVVVRNLLRIQEIISKLNKNSSLLSLNNIKKEINNN